MSFGLGNSEIAFVLLGSGCIPLCDMIYPANEMLSPISNFGLEMAKPRFAFL